MNMGKRFWCIILLSHVVALIVVGFRQDDSGCIPVVPLLLLLLLYKRKGTLHRCALMSCQCPIDFCRRLNVQQQTARAVCLPQVARPNVFSMYCV